MFDGILKTHGKMLAVIGGGLMLVVALVGEEDSPGVLSTVRDQAEAAGPGTLQKPSWLGSQAEPPPPGVVRERNDGIGANAVTFSDGRLTSQARVGQAPDPATVIGTPDGSSRKDESGQPIPWTDRIRD